MQKSGRHKDSTWTVSRHWWSRSAQNIPPEVLPWPWLRKTKIGNETPCSPYRVCLIIVSVSRVLEMQNKKQNQKQKLNANDNTKDAMRTLLLVLSGLGNCDELRIGRIVAIPFFASSFWCQYSAAWTWSSGHLSITISTTIYAHRYLKIA